MKTKLFLLVAACMVLPAMAEITPEEATSVKYLENHGHSDMTAEIVQMSKANIKGEKYITADERAHRHDSKPVKWIRKFFIYFDPALDEGTNFMMHDTKMTPSVNDL